MPENLQFEDLAEDFADLGIWRDIYVLETDTQMWIRFLHLALEGPWEAKIGCGDSVEITPEEAVRYVDEDTECPWLSIVVGGVDLHCRFFGPNEIELDLDPRQLTSEGFEAVCSFMRTLGQAFNRNVYMTQESEKEACVIAYVCESDTYTKPVRPESTTPYGKSLLADVAATLEPFLDPKFGGIDEVPETSAATEAAGTWRRRLYHPNKIHWHTELTSAEFRMLDDVAGALDLFFGALDPAELCRRSGTFTIPGLRSQFWQSLRPLRGYLGLQDW